MLDCAACARTRGLVVGPANILMTQFQRTKCQSHLDHPGGIQTLPSQQSQVLFNSLLKVTVESHSLRFLLTILGRNGSENQYFLLKIAEKRID
jgi:hypothetical protein